MPLDNENMPSDSSTATMVAEVIEEHDPPLPPYPLLIWKPLKKNDQYQNHKTKETINEEALFEHYQHPPSVATSTTGNNQTVTV